MHGTTPPPEVVPFLGGLELHTFRLANGLELRVVPDRRSPVVAYQTWFGVGSADEQADHTGLAHLFEHLMFKATEAYGDGEYFRRLDALGADGLNAWTWYDQTVYTQAVPRQHVERVAELEATRMARLAVDEEQFRSELGVVMNERRLTVDDDPGSRLSEAMLALAYERHPYGWPVIGWMRDLEHTTREDALAFYRRYYAPDNARILIVGDIEPSEALAIVERHYGHLEPSGVRRLPRAVEEEQRALRRTELELPISADRVRIGFKVPPFTHPDTPALLVLDGVLSGGQTSRLRRALVDSGVVADVSSSVVPLRDPTLLVITTQGRPGVAAEVVEQALWAELARIREHGVSEGELRMGVAQWQASTWTQLEEVSGLADFLGWTCTHTGDHRDGLARLAAIDRVTAADVHRVARTWLVPERATVAVGRAPRGEAIEVQPVVPEPIPLPDVRAREPGGQASDPVGETVECEVHGATMVRLHDPTLPLVHLRLWLRSGSACDPRGQAGVAALTGRALLRGTLRRDRQALEAALEQLGASAQVSVDSDGIYLSATVLRDRWPVFAALLRESLLEPAFDEAELAQLRREIDDELASVVDDDDELAEVALRRALWGPSHPYGRDPRGTRAEVAAITRDHVAAFHATHLKVGGAVVGLAGAYDDGAVAELEALLGSLAGDPARPTLPEPTVRQAPSLIVVDKPDRSSISMRGGQLGWSSRDPGLPALVLANDALGGTFTSRLTLAIRVERGWSYYASSGMAVESDHAWWYFATAPGAEVAVDALCLARDVVTATVRDGLDAAELEQVRQARVGGRPFLIDSVRKRLLIRLRALFTGYDRLATVDAMPAVDLPAAHRSLQAIDPQRQVVVLVATADGIRADLEARFGPITELVDYRDLVL